MSETRPRPNVDLEGNVLIGAGLLFGTLTGVPGVTVEAVMHDDMLTTAMLVKFDIGGAPAERGYLVTVTIPAADAP